MRAVDLRCEFLVDPRGIDVRRPRLSWRCDGGLRQTAYRIRVAADGIGDLWDSGRVVSDRSQHIVYDGHALQTGQSVVWSVQLWDQDERTAPDAAVGRWSMGLLDPADWQAQWIGLDTPAPSEALEAIWFWSDEGQPLDRTPPGTRHLRRVFVLSQPVARGELMAFVAAGDLADITVDGIAIGTAYGWADATAMALPALTAGPHVIAAEAHNLGDAPKPAGLAVRLEWAATREILFSDAAGWQSGNPDGGRPVVAWGPTGMAPWGRLALHRPRPVPARWLRKVFQLKAKPSAARVSFCGLGWSELYLNGVRVGDAMLSPPLTDYDRQVTYVTYDVTDHLRTGENVLGVVLGAGRFVAPRPSARDFGWPKLLLRLDAELPGRTVSVVSDETWLITLEGPIRDANEYDGEVVDGRRAIGLDAAGWRPVERVAAPKGALRAMRQPPTRITATLPPVSVVRTGADSWTFDFGQNIAGLCRLRITGEAGRQVTLRHAERLHPDGTLDTANLRSAEARDVFVLAGGGEEIFLPRFTSHGFRYVTATGLAAPPGAGTLVAQAMSDDLRRTGQFDCSDPMLTRIHDAASWSVRNNCRSIRTDCPQRDERQGWLGDVAEEARGEAYLFDNAAFYAKWLGDMVDTQRPDGALSDIAPAYLPLYSDDVAWPAALGAIAGTLHDHYGDDAILATVYPALVRWLDRMRDRGGDAFGDWGAPGMKIPAQRDKLIAAAYLVRCLTVAADLAGRLGRHDDMAMHAAQAAAARARFQARPQDGGATAGILALAFGLAPPDRVAALRESLVAQIMANGTPHPCFGLIGAQWVSRVLQAAGRGDLVHRMAVAATPPGLGSMIARGATTLWELWDADTADPRMASMDHTMLTGDLVAWLYRDLAGIGHDPARPGFARVILAPQPIPTLAWVRASYDAMTGRIESAWHRDGNAMVFEFAVPPNVAATILLPGAAPFAVASGRHRFALPG